MGTISGQLFGNLKASHRNLRLRVLILRASTLLATLTLMVTEVSIRTLLDNTLERALILFTS